MAAHVLIYDHSAVILANFQHHFLNEGFRVTGRFPREMNKDEVTKHQPDVIVLGLSGDASGPMLDRMIRLHDEPTLVHIPIIVATPHHTKTSIEPLPEGVSHIQYTLKPFEISDVLAEARRVTQEIN